MSFEFESNYCNLLTALASYVKYILVSSNKNYTFSVYGT